MDTLTTADSILGRFDLAREVVDVPEWGGSVIVQQLSLVDAARWEQWVIDQDLESLDYRETVYPRLVALSVVDEAGARVFTDDHIAALGGKSKTALERIVTVAQRLNSYTDDDIEELAGNLLSDRSASTDSGSPSESVAR